VPGKNEEVGEGFIRGSSQNTCRLRSKPENETATQSAGFKFKRESANRTDTPPHPASERPYNRSSPKFNTTALGLSTDRQFDDVAIEEMLSQISWVFEGDNERALRDE
jgi:hypothetical protein